MDVGRGKAFSIVALGVRIHVGGYVILEGRQWSMRTEEEMDLWIWSRGLDQWIKNPYSSRTKVPHELDYLRGMHNSNALAVLSDWLTRKVGLYIQLRTMWQDKYVYVKPVVGSRRELADIAVITQRLGMV